MIAALAMLTPAAIVRRVHAAPAAGDGGELVLDTFQGLAAFVVPGPDAHSVHQGVSTPEPGGIHAGAHLAVPFALDTIQLAPPPFASFSELVAFLLNQTAEAVHPGAEGPFPAPFSRLSFDEKALVFALLESDPELAPLAAALPLFVAFTTYSEVGVFDPATGSLVGQPVGWAISGYPGVADGRAELLGYFKPKKKN